MAEINQYALSQALGSTMKPVRRPAFGSFGLLGAVGESLKAREADALDEKEPKFTYDYDRVVAQAFEDVREGAAPDAILWDSVLTAAFNRRCRELGIHAPDSVLNRRLLNIRKNKARYERQGIRLSPTTKSQPHPSIVPQYAHVIEFALVRLRYRFGASIDDILLDPKLGEEYERLALGIAPELDSLSLRIAALYIRKSRFIRKQERESIRSLDPAVLERELSPPISLADAVPEAVPAEPGLIELREGRRFLYIARNTSLRPAVRQMASGAPFKIMESPFWKPDLSAITFQFVAGKNVAHTHIETWERRLICERGPVFNWPMHKACA